jgi:hypothetical protein
VLVAHPFCVSRHMGTFSDIWHWAVNMRPFTLRQIDSPISMRLPVLSVQ